MDITVVVGNNTVEFSNEAHGVIERAVPLSVKLHICKSPSEGVQVSQEVSEVIAVASPVILVIS